MPKVNARAFFEGYFSKEAALKDFVELRPHQKRVLEKLKDTDSLLLYHGLGSGKTLSSIAATEGLDTDVIVPAALRKNYGKELANFTDNKTPRDVMSYEAASKGLKPADAMVLDEAQRINNPGTVRAKTILDAAKKYKRRLLLTGTPIRNRPSDLINLIRVLNPDAAVPKTETDFNKMFVEPERFETGFLGLGTPTRVEAKIKNTKKLKEMLKGRVDYYAPAQAGYPERIDKVREIEMSPEQLDVYDTVTDRANPEIARKIRSNMPLTKKESMQLNAFMSAARQVSNTAGPYGGAVMSPKIEAIAGDFKSKLKKNPQHKGVIYSNYLDGGILPVAQEMERQGIPHRLFTGSLSDAEKEEAVNAYNSGEVKALLISGAGAEGLDLKNTRSIQLMEPHWNKSRLDQVIGRGIRYKSHADLPEDQRNVEVIKYHSKRPRTFWQSLFGNKPSPGADEYLTEVTDKKQRLIDQFNKVLRQIG